MRRAGFLAVDFDKGDWAVDVQAVADSCLKHDCTGVY